MSIFPKHLADLLLLSAFLSMSLFVYIHHPLTAASFYAESPPPPPPLLSHVLFSIAAVSSSLPSRAPFFRLWHSPLSRLNITFLFLFLDCPPPQPLPPSLPPIIIQTNTSSRRHIIQDAIALHVPGIHWYVFGDDHTVFLTKNLVRILSEYDHSKWYYVGSSSETYERQNEELYFDMAYGGGGVLISAPLAKVLDSCLDRYNHLSGSDALFACLTELGVRFTLETEFHSF